VPALQLEQTDAPVLDMYMPTAQFEQAGTLGLEEKVPGWQSTQAAGALYLPREHTTAVHELDPVVFDSVHNAQALHTVDLSTEYVFSAQLVQDDIPEDVENLPAGQFVQLVAPVLDWKVPATHEVHDVAIWLVENEPAEHAEQMPLVFS